jgi:hypothetical protein
VQAVGVRFWQRGFGFQTKSLSETNLSHHCFSDPEVKIVAVDLQDMSPLDGIIQVGGKAFL